MEKLQELHKEKEQIELQLNELTRRLEEIDYYMEQLRIEEKTKEYEEKMRNGNPDMWFFHVDILGNKEYFHITKVTDAFLTDLINGKRRISVEYDRRVSFGRKDYIKVSVDTENECRLFDECELEPAKLDDIKAEMVGILTQQIESLECL